MANVKITELTETTTPETNDLIELAISPDEATPLSRSVSVLNLVGTGWIKSNDTWAYASATTITVPSGAASIYSIGDKIKLTQTTVKYFYVTAIADTVLTVTGGDSYTVADAAITSPYYSKASSPVGFPTYMNWATGSNPQGFSGTPTVTFNYNIVGRLLTYRVYISGTSNATSLSCTLPVAVVTATNLIFRAQDNTSAYTVGLGSVSSTTLTLYTDMAATGWTSSNTKSVLNAGGFYWI